MSVSWHQLQQLQSVLHKTQTKRFAGKRKTPKYGSVSKAFSDSQLQRFLHVIDSDKFRLLFSYQAQLGLRILCYFGVRYGQKDRHGFLAHIVKRSLNIV